MNKDWIQNYSDTHITIFGMILFFMVFVGAILLTFHRQRKDYFNKIQNLPLDEET